MKIIKKNTYPPNIGYIATKIYLSLRFSRVCINFCQCMEVDYIVEDYSRLINFLKSLLHCVGPYIFCKRSFHTNVTRVSIQWNIPSLRIMALQVDRLHILLVLCLLELCVLHCFKVPSIPFSWHLFVFAQNWSICHLERRLRP
jgi:hypothetical protein